MKKNLILLCLTIAITSCSNNDDAAESEQPSYQFASVEYKLKEGNGATTEKLTLSSKSYINNTATDAEVIIAPDNFELFNYSKFVPANIPDVKMEATPTKRISIPVAVSDGKIILGNTEWLYTSLEEKAYTPGSAVAETITLPAGQQMSVKIEVTQQRITASYEAMFVLEAKKDTVYVSGEWTGVTVVSTSTSSKITNIE